MKNLKINTISNLLELYLLKVPMQVQKLHQDIQKPYRPKIQTQIYQFFQILEDLKKRSPIHLNHGQSQQCVALLSVSNINKIRQQRIWTYYNMKKICMCIYCGYIRKIMYKSRRFVSYLLMLTRETYAIWVFFCQNYHTLLHNKVSSFRIIDYWMLNRLQ